MWLYKGSEMKKTVWLILIFIALSYYAVPADPSCNDPGCNADFCSGNTCTKCNIPYFLASGECRRCYAYCRKCAGETCYKCVSPECGLECRKADCPCLAYQIRCTSCPDGFYLYRGICYSCLHTGCKCSSGTDCIDCLSGRYENSSYCKHACPSECISCTSINNCSKCVAGKYGPVCASDCLSLCDDGSCDQDTGYCFLRCPAHQYLDSNHVCRPCRYRCSSCTNYDECTSCKRIYYWGSMCQYDCIGCSLNCSKDEGCVSGCDLGYYYVDNFSHPGYECFPCPVTCQTCSSPAECILCDRGYWGRQCQHNCSNCAGTCDKNNGCSAGCLSGYYQLATNGGMVCEKCPATCVTCSNSSVCSECKTGHFLIDGTNCGACSKNCKNGNCITYNGTCNEGCINGWARAQCKQKCPIGCVQCEQFSPSICKSCIIGYYGTSCGNSCSEHCNETVGAQVCQLSDGDCIYGCKVGHWGSTCSFECGRGCYGNLCNQTTGICLYGCVNNFTGIRCDRKEFQTYAPDMEKAEPDQSVGTESDENSSNNTIVVALSVVAGLIVFLALVAIAGVIMLFKKGQLVFIRNKGNTSSPEPQSQELDNNAYQDLNRTESAEGTYSSVQTDYENTL